MTTEAEIMEFYLMSQRRAARRFLPQPVVPTGFDDLPVNPVEAQAEAVQRPTLGDRA